MSNENSVQSEHALENMSRVIVEMGEDMAGNINNPLVKEQLEQDVFRNRLDK
jgi:hypothetical protein